jgi:NADPH:quinone reductase-like Zn-dependent oxidoreductase
MKAVRPYGSSDRATISIDDVPVPKPAAGEALIRVHATAVTPGEFQWYPTWHDSKGASRVHAVPCHEFSGVIEEIAPDVKGLEKGDEVFGLNNWFRDGAAAEYCVTTPGEIAPQANHDRPCSRRGNSNLGTNCLASTIQLWAGQKVVIQGGAGGVGTIGNQLGENRRETRSPDDGCYVGIVGKYPLMATRGNACLRHIAAP